MKKNIKNWIFLVLAGSALSLQGCKDYFDLNENPSLIAKPSVNSILATVTHKTAKNSYNVASFSTYYSQYFASPSSSSTTDTYQVSNTSGTWNAIYFAMADIHDMIEFAKESDAPHHVGVGKILMAFHLALVTDTWGSGPYKEAFGKVNTLTPKYDSEEDLYKTSLQLIDEGILELEKPTAYIAMSSTLDMIHKGNRQAWLKTAYAIKARLLNKISKKSTYSATAVLAAIDKSYTSNADDATMGIFSGRNDWAGVATSNLNNVLGGWLSSNFIDHLNGTKYGLFDPRIEKITEKTVHGVYVGTRNGQGNVGAANTIHDECYISLKSPLTKDASPLFLITYPEVKFIEAEAAFRSGNPERAYNAYLAGIKANMVRLEVEQAAQDSYINDARVSVGKENLTLDLIFKEKFVVTYLSPEAWNDARRFDYKYKNFQMPVGAALGNFIRRVSIPQDELSRNSANVPTTVSLDVPLWWDKP